MKIANARNEFIDTSLVNPQLRSIFPEIKSLDKFEFYASVK